MHVTKDLLKNYNVGLLTIMLRKKFLNKNNVFKTQYNYLGDLDFVLRFSLKLLILMQEQEQEY